MLKAAANLTRDLNVPRATIYWADMLGSALLGYAALFAAMFVKPNWLALGIGLVAVLALYRAGSFIHELTHIKKGAVKGFRLTWNLIVGVPLLIPSFMYEGVHNQHHAKRFCFAHGSTESFQARGVDPMNILKDHQHRISARQRLQLRSERF